MRIVSTIVVAVTLMASVAPAFAGCPAGTRYSCSQGWNGKVICGCH
jgi:hypothetical protein